MYKDLFNSHFSERKKLNLMTAITGWEPWSWRVVGITIDAVGLVKENNGHSSSARELVRDHYFQGRTETYKKMLSKLLSSIFILDISASSLTFLSNGLDE